MNGKEGLQKAMEEHPVLILSDIMMPEMSGRRIRQQARALYITLDAINTEITNKRQEFGPAY